MTLRVAVIGAGMGGLATAIGIHRAGGAVTVFERTAAPTGAGTALGLWPAALRALDTLGLGEQVRKRAARQEAGEFLRPDGGRIATIDTAGLRRRTGEAVHLLSRPALLEILLQALPPERVRFSQPAEVGQLADGYDVIVAADGIFSATRRELFGSAYQARYLGRTAWRGVVDVPTETFRETWGEGKVFGVTAQEGGRTNWYAAVTAPPEHRYPGGDLAALREHFEGWHAAVAEVLAAVSEQTLLRHDLYELDPPLPSYVRGCVALIGDAAHAMSPHLGRGACEALIDGVTVAAELSRQPSVAAALAGYDRRRRRPTQRLAAMSRRVSALAHARRFTRARDVAVRVALTVGGTPA